MKKILFAAVFLTLNASAMDGWAQVVVGNADQCIESCAQLLQYTGAGMCALGITCYAWYPVKNSCNQCRRSCCFARRRPQKMKMSRDDGSDNV